MAGLNAKAAPKGNGGNRVEQAPMEAGGYPIRVAQVIDLGMQEQRPWQGQEKPPAHEIMLTYEFTDEFMKDENGEDVEDKPRWLSENFPLRHIDQDKAKSTQRYKALDPKMDHDGDFGSLLGAPATAMVITKPVKSGPNAGKERNYVDSLVPMRARDAARVEELQNEGKIFTLEDPDLEIFHSLPEWLQDKIKGNLEYNGSPLQALLEGGEAPDPEPEVPEAEGEDDENNDDETPW